MRNFPAFPEKRRRQKVETGWRGKFCVSGWSLSRINFRNKSGENSMHAGSPLRKLVFHSRASFPSSVSLNQSRWICIHTHAPDSTKNLNESSHPTKSVYVCLVAPLKRGVEHQFCISRKTPPTRFNQKRWACLTSTSPTTASNHTLCTYFKLIFIYFIIMINLITWNFD